MILMLLAGWFGCSLMLAPFVGRAMAEPDVVPQGA
jgi:hypothetical protein